MNLIRGKTRSKEKKSGALKRKNNKIKEKNELKNGTGLFSIRNKLIASFMVTIIPIVLLGMFSYNTAKNSIQETAEQTSLETIKQVSKYIELSLGNITTLSTQIVVNNDLQEYMTKTKDEASYEMLNLQRDVSMNIQNMTFSTPNISSLTVLLENNRSILTTTVQIEKIHLKTFR